MALVVAAGNSPNLISCGALKLPLLEPKSKQDPSWEFTWEEKAVKVFDICCEHLSAYRPKERHATPNFFDLGKESRACSSISEDTSSGCSGETGDVDVSCAVEVDDCGMAVSKEELPLSELDLEWKSELTWEKVLEVLHIIRCQEFTEWDPKTCDFVPTRFCKFNIAFFDFEKESSVNVGPPLSTLGRSGWISLEDSVNVISLKIVESDVGYPIRVFGTVLARDQLDYKCVYLFKRDRDNPQVITSPNDMLTLTGPYRVLAVTDSMFFEINLKIKCDDTGDRDFSKGVIEHNAIRYSGHTMDWLVTSWLSTVELVYAPVQCAVEATIAVNTLKGPCSFTGKVIAWTSGNRKSKIILYNSEAAGTMTETGAGGSVRLSRSVVAVPLRKKLVLHICVSGGDDGFKLTLGQHDDKRICNIGSYELQVKVTWTSNIDTRRQNVFTNLGRTILLW